MTDRTDSQTNVSLAETQKVKRPEAPAPNFMLQPTSALSGIGEKMQEKLQRAGIDTVGDLLYYLPRDYDNFEMVNQIGTLRPGKVVVRGRVKSVFTTQAKSRRLAITQAVITDGTGELTAVWFNQAFRQQQFQQNPDTEYYFEGEFNLSRGRYQLKTPKVTKVSGPGRKLTAEIGATQAELAAAQRATQGVTVTPSTGTASGTTAVRRAKTTQGAALAPSTAAEPNTVADASDQIVPIYPARGALNSEVFRHLFRQFRAEFAQVPDLLPATDPHPDYVTPGGRADALFKAHFPESRAEIQTAREYLAYEEVFELVLASRLSQLENHKLKARPLPFVQANTQALTNSLPFTLTNGQKKASWEILQALEAGRPMNRLLQGDVGSGKTVVAALAIYQAIKAGVQVAFLAPTAILATQHADGLAKILQPLGVRIALLLGTTRNKTSLKQRIAAGEVDLVIGTHALITDTTHFANLGLVIIDEQHRFGVNQRQKLLMKSPPGLAPHLLAMTATPIPRSLQLSIFGDLDISTLTELPRGRQPITTKLISEINLRADLYPEISATIAAGHQVYWICRNIEDNALAETAGVKSQTTKLREVFPRARVEFLHGRLDAAEKDRIMAAFAAGQIDILVSTTVVEVGVDVPNATLIAIMDADNYGLAQLHQLRGRVGRGQVASTCYLITTGDGRPSRRLKEMQKSNDGFHLAEIDLKMRGPGEIYGALQHGALDLRIATLSDTRTIAAASRQVKEFLREPEALARYPELEQRVHKYQQLTLLN